MLFEEIKLPFKIKFKYPKKIQSSILQLLKTTKTKFYKFN
jgi:hypothetical protein